jgi:murein DD-endopeptidase MepM/ murein hydrolase activator NlpD
METRYTLAGLIFVLLTFMTAADDFHVLKTGETLYQLSRLYGVSVEEIKSANRIGDVTDIAAGTRLRIPGVTAPGGTYQVKPGDTLYSIARSHSMDINELLALNKLDSSHLLLVGEELTVSAGTVIPPQTEKEMLVETPQKDVEQDTDPYFWPHQGVRTVLDGKVMGKEISGSNGDPVVSVSSGKVIWVAPYHGYGKIVMVESPDKHIFAYGGNSDTLVNVGEFVRPGQKLGLLGSNGRESLPKVYFFVYKNGKPVDPDAAPRK